MIKILIADDHAVVRKGVKHILSDFPDRFVVYEATDGVEVLEKVQNERFDIIILDIAMPDKDGIETLKEIKSEKPKLPVLMLSMYPEEQFAMRALKSGASGYLTKESMPDELAKAIQKILRGGKYVSESLHDEMLYALDQDTEQLPHEALSDREYQIMVMIANGIPRKQIAERLFLSAKTISTYRARILEKMRLKTNADLTSYVLRHKLKA